VVKVLDFGLAKPVLEDSTGSDEATASAESAALSRPGLVAGTVGYMSPEQASGRTVDARSDVFSFGAVLYEMVTGRRAFAGDSSAETLAAILKEEPKALSELVPGVPKELERIVARCLRKQPGRRFQHMTDLKVELQEVGEESDSQAAAPGAGVAATLRSRRRWNAWAATGLVVLAAGAFALWRQRPPELPAPRLVQLSSSRHAGNASFSPDGNEVVYASTGERGEDNWDLWLKMVGEAESRRLTTDPAADGLPAWSPDGKQIAFVRFPAGAAGRIYVVSPLGGSERRVVDFPADGGISWSPDGRWLATGRNRAEGQTTPESGGIYLVPIGGGTPRAVTFPKPPLLDGSPAFSPDGRFLAYASCGPAQFSPPCDVYVLSLDSDLRPRGEARRLTWMRRTVWGLAWTRDGRSLVLGSDPDLNEYMWRVRADGGAPPERVELAGPRAYSPALARGQDRLAFSRHVWDQVIYRLPLGGSPTPFIESTEGDAHPQYAPDGLRIAFSSGRSGEGRDIWLANGDGSNAVRLTKGPGRWQGSPRWSPDGRTIVFDSRSEEGQWDIWTIDVDGMALRQVTHEPSNENMPSFSRDGHWIYFSSDRTGRNEVWRVPVTGGIEEQVTREGGAIPFESLDGRTLYYMRSFDDNALLARPTGGGEERTILSCVNGRSYAVGPQGIFHVDCSPPETAAPSTRVLRHRDAATGNDRVVGQFDAVQTEGLAVSPDGRSVLYDIGTVSEHLMMIENFR